VPADAGRPTAARRASLIRGGKRRMSWSLRICTFDVGAGDASLIVARHPGLPGQPAVVRSILIDGGTGDHGRLIHRQVSQILPSGIGPDVILATHFDSDHVGGITSILFADNLSTLCRTIAPVVAQAVTNPLEGALGERLAAARIACVLDHKLIGNATAAPANHFDKQSFSAVNVEDAIEQGVDAAERAPGQPADPLILVNTRSTAVDKTARYVAALFKLGGTPNANQVATAVVSQLFASLSGCVPKEAQFDTGGIYRKSAIIDPSPAGKSPDNYVLAKNGYLKFSGRRPMLGVVRHHVPATLGTELFWNRMRNPLVPATAPYPNAPYAVLIAGPSEEAIVNRGQAWQGEHNAPSTFKGQASNALSIGLVLRFNRFMFFTAGDLPFEGEDLLASALVGQPLPTGFKNTTFGPPPPPPPLVAFKCSHHGSKTSTSAQFLQVLQPKTAIISCGSEHRHPDDEVIKNLQQSASIEYFFLTNCLEPRADVPASIGKNYKPKALGSVEQNERGNKSRVSGDNVLLGNVPNRHRGDVSIFVDEANSLSAPGAGQYRTSYWENYPPSGYPRAVAHIDTQW
jgi:hypothetical protein